MSPYQLEGRTALIYIGSDALNFSHPEIGMIDKEYDGKPNYTKTRSNAPRCTCT
jgi:hypothetical protein